MYLRLIRHDPEKVAQMVAAMGDAGGGGAAA